MTASVVLGDLKVLAVTGPDRASLLQGQLTQDVTTAGPSVTVLAGWADPKGRLLFAGHLFATRAGPDEALGLLVPAELGEALVKRLRMYVLRARASVMLLDTPVVGLLDWPPRDLPEAAVELAGDSRRHLLVEADGGTDRGIIASEPPETWALADIRAGLPTVFAATQGEFLPQMLNLDLLAGISFTKGCYTGQEIVARTRYLGRVKRRMLRFAATEPPPPAGSPLYAERGIVGQVVNAAATESGSEFLAVVVLDDLPGPLGLHADGSGTVRRLDLPYQVSA